MVEKVQPLDDFWNDVAGDYFFPATEFPLTEHLDGFVHGESIDAVDWLIMNEDVT